MKHEIDQAPLTFAQTKPPLRDCRTPTYVVIMGLRVTFINRAYCSIPPELDACVFFTLNLVLSSRRSSGAVALTEAERRLFQKGPSGYWNKLLVTSSKPTASRHRERLCVILHLGRISKNPTCLRSKCLPTLVILFPIIGPGKYVLVLGVR